MNLSFNPKALPSSARAVHLDGREFGTWNLESDDVLALQLTSLCDLGHSKNLWPSVCLFEKLILL